MNKKSLMFRCIRVQHGSTNIHLTSHMQKDKGAKVYQHNSTHSSDVGGTQFEPNLFGAITNIVGFHNSFRVMLYLSGKKIFLQHPL